MAIIFPESCRGITAGALRQIKQQGFTTAGKDGGACSKDYVQGLIFSQTGFTRKNEPLGIFMSQLTEATKTINETTEAISASSRKMVNEATTASAALTDASRKMRDATDKLTAQMQKFHTVFSNSKFDDQARAAQSLADALDRLAKLEEKGMLTKVIAALNRG